MKKIMLSVQPQWLAKILNGEKTVEIRKTAPKLQDVEKVEVYCYCTKRKPFVYYMMRRMFSFFKRVESDEWIPKNGKVACKFTLEKVEWVRPRFNGNEWVYWDDILGGACIDNDELTAYLGYQECGYAWHIDNLVIFDKPMELKQFGTWDAKRWHENGTHWFPLNRAPQSWQYVEVLK